MAILYHLEAQFDIAINLRNDTWLHTADIIDNSDWIRYLNSFYVASHSMVTSNVYTPKTPLEIFFISFSAILNCGIYSIALNNLFAILEKNNKKGNILKEKLLLLN